MTACGGTRAAQMGGRGSAATVTWHSHLGAINQSSVFFCGLTALGPPMIGGSHFDCGSPLQPPYSRLSRWKPVWGEVGHASAATRPSFAPREGNSYSSPGSFLDRNVDFAMFWGPKCNATFLKILMPPTTTRPPSCGAVVAWVRPHGTAIPTLWPSHLAFCPGWRKSV